MGLPPEGHHFVKFPEKRLKYYRLLKPGQYWRDLPESLHQEALGASYHAGGGKTGFYRRLAWDKPAPTLVTHPAMPATDLAHPTEDRPLSIEEYKRIQELPDDWVIAGKLLDQYRQVGNAVPASLGRAIAKMLLAHLNGENPIVYPDFPYSRYHKTDDVNWLAEVTGCLEAEPTPSDEDLLKPPAVLSHLLSKKGEQSFVDLLMPVFLRIMPHLCQFHQLGAGHLLGKSLSF